MSLQKSISSIFGGLALLVASQAHATTVNTLYMCEFASPSSLFTLNAATGAKTLVGPTGFNQCTDIAFRGHLTVWCFWHYLGKYKS